MKFSLIIASIVGTQAIKVQEDGSDASGKYFLPNHDGMIGAGGYERVTPLRFAADEDDIFMRSMI